MRDDNFLERLENSFLDIADGAADFVPKLLVALLLVGVGVVIARYVSKWIGQIVDYVEKSKQVRATTESLGIKEVDIDVVYGIRSHEAKCCNHDCSKDVRYEADKCVEGVC